MASDLLAAHRHTTKNRAEIEASRVCDCFYCQQTFAPADIVAWAGMDMSHFTNPDAAGAAADETALCPRCGSESVIGDKSGFPINPAFLTRMHEAWFQKTIIRKPAPKK